ncbi:MAG: NADH-quinone oxidoreductase subunit NuoK [Thermoplasmatales archaeon]|jgi:NADH-quinone oxidoreductase subunit K|nr:NADH-quinone oxidoreductase subunit NuoK [Candidatus Thermoplasmatota archaeon]MCW6166914.1 NADH-quinone oxidoreductase subunit NuoK [Thermoplasmatales archaeon]
MTTLSIDGFIGLSIALLAISIFGILTRRNFILLLISVEIGMNAAILNFLFFAAFPNRSPFFDGLQGQSIAIVLVGLAATEVAVGLAIVLALNRLKGTINVAEASSLRE